MARYPDSNFIYTSFAQSVATDQTSTIRQILEMPEYQKIFGMKLDPTTAAKHHFKTTAGGTIYAAGSGGPITSRGAGIAGQKRRFGGCGIIDDIHKPNDIHSDVVRESDIKWFDATFASRLNEPEFTPIIAIGQRLHEADFFEEICKKRHWKGLELAAIDAAGNALNPAKHSLSSLKLMQERYPYEFAAQYQQNPQPAGGGIFKPEWFPTYTYEQPISMTFITIDTAETDKTYNDATVFSFWGLHKVQQFGRDSAMWGLHWLDCLETFIEPKDLEYTFVQFATECFAHKVPPSVIGIEAKSTGVTLASVLRTYQGIRTIEFKPDRSTGSVVSRFLDIQSFITRRLVSLPQHGKHTSSCLEHIRKITANNTHRRDDIAVTMYYAIKMALIDKVLISQLGNTKEEDDTVQYLAAHHARQENLRKKTTW